MLDLNNNPRLLKSEYIRRGDHVDTAISSAKRLSNDLETHCLEQRGHKALKFVPVQSGGDPE